MGEPRQFSPSGEEFSAAVRVARCVARKADEQDAVLKTAHLLRCGLSHNAIARWRRDGHLRRRYPGVHIYARGPLTRRTELTAGLFYAGRGAALGDLTALHRFGVVEDEPGVIHIVTRNRRAPQAGLGLCRMTRFERVFHDELPVLPLATALRQAAFQMPFRDLRRALSEAEFRKLVVPAEIAAELGRGRKGSAALRRAWRLHQPKLARTKEELERRFWFLCEDGDIPPHEPNHPIGRMRVDGAWPDRKHAVELDSRLAHGTSNRMERDLNRELELRRRGWTISRYSWEQVTERGDEVLADLRRCLGIAA